MRRIHIIVLIAGGIISVLMIALFVYHLNRPTNLKEESYKIYSSNIGETVIEIDGDKTFRQNEIVQISFWAGVTESPSGEFSISMDKGRIGIVKKKVSGGILEVQWLEQEWSKFPFYWSNVFVPEFTCSINTDWLIPLTVNPEPITGEALGKPVKF